jgi:hypothetical protein
MSSPWYGGAKLTDKYLAFKIHRVDDQIIEWLERRESRKPSRPFNDRIPKLVP